MNILALASGWLIAQWIEAGFVKAVVVGGMAGAATMRVEVF